VHLDLTDAGHRSRRPGRLMKVAFTHKGWFGIAPVYMADVDTDSPRLEPRVPFTGWLISLSAAIFDLLNAEAFPIKFTGELTPPKMIEVDA
jgi:hypothetical protein